MNKKSMQSDVKRLDRMKDRDIDYSDLPPLGDSFFKRAVESWPPVKQQVTVRLDADVLRWLKAHGRVIRHARTAFFGSQWNIRLPHGPITDVVRSVFARE